MSDTRPIMPDDDLALVNIVLDYTRGHSIDEIKLRLKEQCARFNIACKTRYEAIKYENDDSVDSRILDALSVGGCQLHLMSAENAQKDGKGKRSSNHIIHQPS